MKTLTRDENAVSFSIGFILTFSITSMILIMVLLLLSNMMHQYGRTITYAEYDILGNNMAMTITSMDDIVATTQNANGTMNSLEYGYTIPSRIAGNTYHITISKSEIILSDNDIERRIPLATQTNITASTISSGEPEHKILYNQTSKELEVY